MLEYNTKGGKMNRGMGVVDVLRAFAASEGRELRHEEVRREGACGVWGVLRGALGAQNVPVSGKRKAGAVGVDLNIYRVWYILNPYCFVTD